jgi:hypothetical protein
MFAWRWRYGLRTILQISGRYRVIFTKKKYIIHSSFSKLKGKLDIFICIVTVWDRKCGPLFLTRARDFSLLQKCQAFSAAHEVNCPVDTKVMTQGVMWLGQEPYLSPPSTAPPPKKKKKHGAKSTLPPYTSMAQCLIKNRNILSFPFIS